MGDLLEMESRPDIIRGCKEEKVGNLCSVVTEFVFGAMKSF